MFQKYVRILLLVLPITVLTLSACAPSTESVSATQTQAVAVIYTAAAQTIEAKAALVTATPEPTETPAPSQTPTAFFTQTAAATSIPPTSPIQNYCDNSLYISDMTIPDNTVLEAGQVFEKTWAIQNTGTCTWTESYAITFVSGDIMGGEARTINQSVASQQQANVSIKLTAPTNPGTYTGFWRLSNSKGASFGQILSIVIKVGVTSTATVTTTAGAATTTPTVTPSPAATVTHTATVISTP